MLTASSQMRVSDALPVVASESIADDYLRHMFSLLHFGGDPVMYRNRRVLRGFCNKQMMPAEESKETDVRRLVHLLLLSGLVSSASAGLSSVPVSNEATSAEYQRMIDCVRNVDSKSLRLDRPFSGGHRFFFQSKRTSSDNSVEVTIFHDEAQPVRVSRYLGEWLGIDERLAAEVEACAGEKVAVYRGKRRSGGRERDHMPTLSKQMLNEASREIY